MWNGQQLDLAGSVDAIIVASIVVQLGLQNAMDASVDCGGYHTVEVETKQFLDSSRPSHTTSFHIDIYLALIREARFAQP